ncbi:hypothetical protein Anas_12186 [Armadillidium nasatum]|uniref:Uncharacterized protein n=1 Tax=Armadillidium nasatum TaxID=96803 RepID=A0A5N5T5G3_9CRUS|nr:hypothetical protein Anas_12186 [Armadillidium nasatum]
MAICNCCLTIIANYMETFYYQTAPLNFYTIFPVVISALTITGLCIAPKYLKPPEIEAEEETNILKMRIPRKKNWNKKRT